jgi:hypothetical protein
LTHFAHPVSLGLNGAQIANSVSAFYMDPTEYLIGYGRTSDNTPMWIGYRTLPRGGNSDDEVAVGIGEGPGSEGFVLPPKRVLEFEYGRTMWDLVNGKPQYRGYVKEPPGWFERKCREANCEWFVPMVKRMAAGERVPLEEIQAAYQVYNGKPMPCGSWTTLFVRAREDS